MFWYVYYVVFMLITSVLIIQKSTPPLQCVNKWSTHAILEFFMFVIDIMQLFSLLHEHKYVYM